jgi:hypothetical protein
MGDERNELTGGIELVAFEGCEPLGDHLRTVAMDDVGPYGLDGGRFEADGGPVDRSIGIGDDAMAAPMEPSVSESGASGPATTASGTNVQVAGVDEPDLAKITGTTLVTLVGTRLVTVDLAGDEPRQVGELSLPGSAEQLLVEGDRALVIADQPMVAMGGGAVEDAAASLIAPTLGATLLMVDLSDMAEPAVLSSTVVDGFVVDARLVGDTARVAIATGAPDLGWVQPLGSRGEETASEANRRVASEAEAEDWLPTMVTVTPDGEVDDEPVATCAQVSASGQDAGVGTLSIVSAHLDDARIDPAETVTVVGAGEDVYATADHLYVAGSSFGAADETATVIHSFETAGDATPTYTGSAQVPGHLLNQFSMDEHDGHLRVATTGSDPRSGLGSTQSMVTVLQRTDDGLRQVGQVGDLGRGEEIYSVRFIDDTGYVVTFRQTDPLYTVDLADPTSPEVTGELKIAGYSAYLHPVGDGRLLGVGQDATAEGRTTGVQVSLFDVSDPAAPTRMDQWAMPGGDSEAESDHHAFLWSADDGLALLPVQAWGDVGTSFVGAVGLDVGDGSLGERGRIVHGDAATRPSLPPLPTPPLPCDPDGQCDEIVPMEPAIVDPGSTPIRRAFVVDDSMLTISDSGLMVSDLATFTTRSWLAW